MFRSSLGVTAALTFALAASAAQAQSYRPDPRVSITPITSTTFSTSASGQFGAQGAWCAAAYYTMRNLGLPGTTRIFVREPVSRPGSRVVFGVGAGGTEPQFVGSVSGSLRVPGANLSAHHAFGFCADTRFLRNR